MTVEKLTTGRGLLWALVVAAPLIATAPGAQAVLLEYEFNGIAAAGSSLDLGGGPVDLSGAAFTITGMTTSDVDIDLPAQGPGDGFGAFPSMSVYSFGGLGSFVADASTVEFYLQDCVDATSVQCTGFFNSSLAGFVAFTPLPVAGNPDYGIPLGTSITSAGTNSGTPYILTNLAGHVLNLELIGTSITTFSVTAHGVPEPVSLALVALGLLGLGLRRRQLRYPAQGPGPTASGGRVARGRWSVCETARPIACRDRAAEAGRSCPGPRWSIFMGSHPDRHHGVIA